MNVSQKRILQLNKKIVIAIEGIDQIGKTTFCRALQRKLSEELEFVKTTYEKPTIGLNNINKTQYPLSDIRSIFAIRNIGLFEEFLFNANTHYINCKDSEIIIRDRFNFSELAYGTTLRAHEYDIFENIGKYIEWNSWFEKSLDDIAIVIPITFYLNGNANEDEVVASGVLNKVNKKFKDIHMISEFKNKQMIMINMDSETNLTDILDFVPQVYNQIMEILNKQ